MTKIKLLFLVFFILRTLSSFSLFENIASVLNNLSWLVVAIIFFVGLLVFFSNDDERYHK